MKLVAQKTILMVANMTALPKISEEWMVLNQLQQKNKHKKQKNCSSSICPKGCSNLS